MTKTWSFISFVHELYFIFFWKPYARLFCYFFCLVSFFFLFHLSLHRRFFNDLPTLPHVPTASKASLFMLANEHPRCTRGPWRIVLPFFATSTTIFSDLRAVQVLLAICLWCPTIIWSKLNSEVGRRRLIRTKTSLRGCIKGHERCIKMTQLPRTYHNLLTK